MPMPCASKTVLLMQPCVNAQTLRLSGELTQRMLFGVQDPVRQNLLTRGPNNPTRFVPPEHCPLVATELPEIYLCLDLSPNQRQDYSPQ